MAGQDLTNYTRLWNPILEALSKSNLTSKQYRLCMALFQNTYSWHRKQARMSYRDFERDTNIKAKKIGEPLRQLINLGIFIEVEEPKFNTPGLYEFNKDIREWDSKVLDVNQISEKSLEVVAEECGGEGVPKIGAPPRNGDTQNGDSPQNGGEGSPPKWGHLTGVQPLGDKQPENPKERSKEIDHDLDDNNAREETKQVFQKEFGRPLSSMEINWIDEWEQKMPPELIRESLRKAVLQNKRTLKYMDSILHDWKENGVKTLEDVKQRDELFKKQKKDGVKIRGPDNSGAGKHEGKTKKSKYDGLVPKTGGG